MSEIAHKKHHHKHKSHQISNEQDDYDTDLENEGVNNLHQVKAKHKKHHGKKYHEPVIRSWHITTIGENESVTEAMDR